MPDQPNSPCLFSGFVAGTKIMTPNGPVAIEDLKIGDYIVTGPVDNPEPPDFVAGDQDDQDRSSPWWEYN